MGRKREGKVGAGASGGPGKAHPVMAKTAEVRK